MHKIKVDNMLPSVPQYIITYEVVAEWVMQFIVAIRID